MDQIVEFYRGWHADRQGRTIDDIRSWSLERLEETHDFIQWLFPLTHRSELLADAPVLTAEQVATFRRDRGLQRELLTSLDVMLTFYGFQRTDRQICRSGSWEARAQAWITSGNHNFRRISRILTSLTLLGLRDYAEAFLEALELVYADHATTIGPVTHGFWVDATRS